MKQWILLLLFNSVLSNGANDNAINSSRSSHRLHLPVHVNSPRDKRSKSVVERALMDQLLSEQESSPRSKDIFKIWGSNPQEQLPGVSVTLCKVVRSKSVPHVEVESFKDPSPLMQEERAQS